LSNLLESPQVTDVIWLPSVRFMMWYGDCKICANVRDLRAEETNRAGAALAIEFRKDAAGLGK
jgi:hypothetical protein